MRSKADSGSSSVSRSAIRYSMTGSEVSALASIMFCDKIEAKQADRALRTHPARDPPEAAAQISHALAGERGQHGPDCRPLGRAIEPMYLSRQLAVASEEIGIVVDILCHVS